MLHKINKEKLVLAMLKLNKINKNLFIWLLLFFVLLPLENVYATIVCPKPNYSSYYIYLYILIALIIIVYVIIMLILSRVFIFIKNRNTLRAFLLFLLFLLFSVSLFSIFISWITIFSTFTAIIITILVILLFAFIFSRVSDKNKILFLRVIITSIIFFAILFATNYFNNNILKYVKGLKNSNTATECKKSGGILRPGVCVKYCDFVNSDSGKSCDDNNDCEGYCDIENYYSRRSEIRDAWNKYYSDYDKVKIDDWNDKTKIEMKGECNKFKSENEIPPCVDFYYEIIGVEDGFVKRINCITYYEWEF